MLRRLVAAYSVLLSVFAGVPRAQSTQVIVGGRVTHLRTGEAIPNAVVGYRNLTTNVSGSVEVDGRGYYSLPSLPPDVYTLRVEASGFQAREIQARDFYVAARLELNFDLRPLSEVFETGDNRSSNLRRICATDTSTIKPNPRLVRNED